MQLLIKVFIIESVLTLDIAAPEIEDLSAAHAESLMAERDTVPKAIVEDMMASLHTEIEAKIRAEIEADHR